MVSESRILAQASVTIIFSPRPREVRESVLQVPLGSKVHEVLTLGARRWGMPSAELLALDMGVWGRRVSADQVLSDGDRLEIYRPLTVDPKVARRERFIRQGAKSAGLFAARRAGAKAGY